MKISLVLPCYNQAPFILQNIERVKVFLDTHHFDYEIIAVNDGSTDKTFEYLREAQERFGIRVISYTENRGKGAAIKEGVKQASGEFIGFLDSDLAIPIEELPKFVEALSQGTDIAIASRFLARSTVRIPVLWYRRILEKIFQLLRHIILDGHAVRDTQCGFKFFTAAFAQTIFPKSRIERFAFDAELIFLASKFAYRIEEIPVALQNPPKTSVRILRDSFSMATDLLKVRLWNRAKEYNDVRIQVTFDDFGISQKANERILTLLEQGIGQRVAVMTGGAISKEEAAALKSFPVKLDLHLDRHKTITGERSLYGSFFPRIAAFFGEYLRLGTKEITKIWKDQMEDFHTLFLIYPDGLNSHEHVHFFLPYFAEALRLKKKYHIAHLRSGMVRPFFHAVALVLLVLSFFDRRLFTGLLGEEKKYLVSWDWIEERKNPLSYCAQLARKGELELIFHPERDREFAFLTENQEARELLKRS